MNPSVSVIIPCYNEEKYIDQVCRDISDQDYDQQRLEVLFVDGLSSDHTRNIIQDRVSEHGNFRLLDNPRRYVPFALNKGILESKGEIIVRMDAHARYPRNYISRLVEVLILTGADNAGGMWHTLPAHDGLIPLAIARAMSSVFGIGNALYRLKVNKLTQVDTVPFGCYKRDVFNRIGLFDEELIRNQDDEMNARLIQQGGRIFLVPDVSITYFARDTVQKMMRMFYQYGLFKPLVNRKIKHPATLRQFVPPVFVVFIAGLLVLTFFDTRALAILACLLLLHLAAGCLFSIREAIPSRKYLLIPVMPFIFLMIHLSYGFGYLQGIFRFIIFKKRVSVIGSSR